MDATPNAIEKTALLLSGFAERAARHDRDASFPFENFRELADAGLLRFPVARAWGGGGASIADAGRVIGLIGQADPATALVLTMHYMHHLIAARGGAWPEHLLRKIVPAPGEVALINALRVEPDLGSPARGGLPATVARRIADGWRLTGRKIYSTGSPILRWYSVFARTDDEAPQAGLFLVPAGLPGTSIIETWDHLGLRASGSHDVVFEDVLIPADHVIELRKPEDWRKPDLWQANIQAVLIGSLYDGIARAARDWLLGFLKTRVPSGLGAPLATLPRMQEVVGAIEARLAVNARLIGSLAADIDAGAELDAVAANIIKLTVTNNAIAAVEDALSVTSNHGLSRSNPLERHYRDVLCGRVHTPQDDSTRIAAGRRALGL